MEQAPQNIEHDNGGNLTSKWSDIIFILLDIYASPNVHDVTLCIYLNITYPCTQLVTHPLNIVFCVDNF